MSKITFNAIHRTSSDNPTYRLLVNQWTWNGWTAELIKGRWMVYNESKPRTVVDWPIIHNINKIAWDNPYAIPAYVKKRFYSLVRLLKDTEVQS